MVTMYRPLTVDELATTKQGQRAIKMIEDDPLMFPNIGLDGARYFPYHGNNVVGMPYFLTFGDLMVSREYEVFQQLDLYHSKGYTLVASVLADTAEGFLKIRRLLKDISVGYTAIQCGEDGVPNEGESPTIIGGRHRLVALLTAYALSGVDVFSSEFMELKIRVQPLVFDDVKAMLEYIEADNGSRRMSATEKTNIHVANLGIDTDSIEEILDYTVDGQSTSKFSDALRLSFVYFARHSGTIDEVKALPFDFTIEGTRTLELHTAGVYGAAVATPIKKAFAKLVKDKMFVGRIVIEAWNEFVNTLETTTETNIARAKSMLAPAIAMKVIKSLSQESKALMKQIDTREKKLKAIASAESVTSQPEVEDKVVEMKPKRTRAKAANTTKTATTSGRSRRRSKKADADVAAEML